MTTYTVQGIKVHYTNDIPDDALGATLEFVTTDNYQASYSTTGTFTNGQPEITWSDASGTLFQVLVDGVLVSLSDFDLVLGEITWDDAGNQKSTYTLSFDGPDIGTTTDYYFVLDGDALPLINNVADFNDFDDSIIGAGPITDILFTPDIAFNLSDLSLISASEKDKIIGTSAAETFSTGAARDVIKGMGGADILDGGAGKDIIKGGRGNDTITGGKGNDKMSGNGGADDFIFNSGFGNDIITDFNEFNNKEDIDLSGVTQIKGWNDLNNNHMEQVDADVVITQGVNTITLLDVDIGDLGKGDFLF